MFNGAPIANIPMSQLFVASGRHGERLSGISLDATHSLHDRQENQDADHNQGNAVFGEWPSFGYLFHHICA